MPRRKCVKNKDALRWCSERNASIIFSDNKCTVHIAGYVKVGKSLISAVNQLIEHFNEMAQ